MARKKKVEEADDKRLTIVLSEREFAGLKEIQADLSNSHYYYRDVNLSEALRHCLRQRITELHAANEGKVSV